MDHTLLMLHVHLPLPAPWRSIIDVIVLAAYGIPTTTWVVRWWRGCWQRRRNDIRSLRNLLRREAAQAQETTALPPKVLPRAAVREEDVS